MERIRRQSSRFEWRLLSLVFLVALTGFASVAEAAYSLPADRSVVWQGNVGVKGDIPSRTTIYKTLSPSGGDDTSAIQTAINNCPSGQVVSLASGTFKVSNQISVKSGVTLRGAGMGTTWISGQSGMGGSYVVAATASYSFGSSISITGGLNKGSTTITTSTAHGWNVDDIIVIDQLNNANDDPPVINIGNNGTCTWCGRSSGARTLGQVAKIVAVPSSTTAILEIPLYWNYDSSLSPQGTKISGVTTNAGIENLTVDNSLSSKANTIGLAGASNCWVLNVEGIGSYNNMITLLRCYRSTVRGCKLHEGVPATPYNGTQYSPGRAYGFHFTGSVSGCLIENNQIYHLLAGFMLDGEVSGNVISYNYITALASPATTWNLHALSFHGAHPMMNLIEGNYSDGTMAGDHVWGSSSHNTFFRNKHGLTAGKTGGAWAIDVQYQSQYFNIVGNVLGTPEVENAYSLFKTSFSSSNLALYRFGYDGNSTSSSPSDPQSYSTILRYSNWDSIHNSVITNDNPNSSNDGTGALLPSFYLTSKPAWWNNLQWPAIGPDVVPMYPAAPGAGNGTPWSSSNYKAINPPVLTLVN